MTMTLTGNGASAVLDGAIVQADFAAGAVEGKLNASGDAPMFACRAWVNFDGTRNAAGGVDTLLTNRFIRGSGNVASVLRNAAGDYTVNFTTAMPDANYSPVIGIGGTANAAGARVTDAYPLTTTSVRLITFSSGFAVQDQVGVHVHIMR